MNRKTEESILWNLPYLFKKKDSVNFFIWVDRFTKGVTFFSLSDIQWW